MNKKNFALLAPYLWLAFIAVLVIGGWWTMGWLLSTEDPVARNVNAPKVPYFACVATESAGGDTPLIIIDLSDSANFPHTGTSEVVLRCGHYQGSLNGNIHWDMRWGVVLENDATDGSVMWLHRQHRSRQADFDESWIYASGGLNTRVTSGALVYGTSNFSLTNSAIFSSGAVITSPVGTSSPAAGDIVAWLEEVDDGAVLEYSICLGYDTQ